MDRCRTLIHSDALVRTVVDPNDLLDLPPARFGEVVAEVLADAWAGSVDVAPASPAGVVDAVVSTDGERRLVHVEQGRRIEADVVRDLVSFSERRGDSAPTLVTPGRFTDEARGVATDESVHLLDGETFVAIVEAAGVEVEARGVGTTTTIAAQLAGRWSDPLRERAVELAELIDGVATFDREVTITSARTDVDFKPAGTANPVARMRFTETSLLVYVRRRRGLQSVVRLTAFRTSQPPLDALVDDLGGKVRAAIEECSDLGE